jgi:acetolactate synthase I/III small subunit
MPKHIVTCQVRNDTMTLVRIAGLCVHRRYATELIIAGPGNAPGVGQITLVIEADQPRIVNAVKQIDKLVDVLRIDLMSPASPAECDLLLTRISSMVNVTVPQHVAGVGGPDVNLVRG